MNNVMRTCVKKHLIWGTALLALAGTTPAVAQDRFSDPSSGLGLAVPAPFTVEPVTRRQFDVGFGVKSSTGTPPSVGTDPFICQGGFKAASQNAGLTREEINAFIAKPEWRNVVRATIELAFTITAERSFTLAGFRGIELQARPKMGPGADDVRALMSIVETSKGRTTLICLTNRQSFARALPQFRAVRAGLTIPQ
jgi:hypothetical protein